ncbi:hypothetical protein B7R21_07700 [Subtercola boreus]|uniref:DUF4352 domain-containing protein n=1 Tax=Subtercola boreus TaxID=120213 RepID=A0A3E0VW48_9MICO|nr:hypothetical protein [Subtercola boreus]RFA13709.1 hypothetical protein B7R21_07700 [Subtercola boreus]
MSDSTEASVADTTPAPPRTPVWRHIANGAALAGILFASAVALHTAPTEGQWQAPITVTGELGQTVAGRNIQATVTSVRVAEKVTASNGWSGSTSGVWVVVDASVEAVITDFGVSLGTAQLEIGGTHYSASERPEAGSISDEVLSVGLAKTGPLMFEVPRDALTGIDGESAEIHLAVNSDPRADSMIVVPVDLSAIPVESSIETEKPVWGDE